MSDKPQLPIVRSQTPIAFAGEHAGLEKFFQLEQWNVEDPAGGKSDRIVWERRDFVLIVALTPDDNTVLIKEYKQAHEQVFAGLPAGGIKKGETPAEAALRELNQETGYIGQEENCKVAGPFFNSPDKSTERHFVVLVGDVSKEGEATPEEDETILGVKLLPFTDVGEKLQIGLHRMAVLVITHDPF